MMNETVRLREYKQEPELRKRIEDGRVSRRWSRRMNLDETYRAPSHFTWRC
jgi:hypothetical protein